jgi:ribosomal protein L40E
MPDEPQPPRRDVSPERKMTYYVGNAMTLVGVLLFLSTFFTFVTNFGKFDDETPRRMAYAFGRAVIGIVLCGVGQAVANVGRRGLAGSGVVLDPQQQRAALEPWNRSAGGMLNDALSEVDALKSIGGQTTVVKVRCPKCKALNDETAKFCSQCGSALT